VQTNSGLGWLVVLGVIGGAGCGVEAAATLLNNPPHPFRPRPPETVGMFSSAPPTRPHVDVALIESDEESENSFASTAALLAKMRERAAELGCDALVIGHEYSNQDVLLSSLTGKSHQARGFSGTCIMYTDAGAPPPVAAPSASIAIAAGGVVAAPTVPLPPPSSTAANGRSTAANGRPAPTLADANRR